MQWFQIGSACHRAERAFALPTVLVTSLIMMTLMLTAVTATSSIRTSLNDQYYNQLAQEAAESGVALATLCLRQNDYRTVWDNNATSSLRKLQPQSSCNGNVNSGRSQYVLENGTFRTTFEVVTAPGSGDAGGLVRVKATGTVQLLRTGTSLVWREYKQTIVNQSTYVDNPQLGGGAGWKTGGHIGYFLSGTGILYGWGDNDQGQIGDVSLGTEVTIPVAMNLPTGVTRVKKIASSGQGASMICIIGSNDQVYCRGDGEIGSPTWQQFGLPSGLSAVQLDIDGWGSNNVCVVASNSDAYCAGENYFGSLGAGTTSSGVVPLASPVRFAVPTTIDAKKIMTKDYHTCIITSANEAWCAGRNDWGQLGRGSTVMNTGLGHSVPAKVPLPTGVEDIKFTHHAGSHTIHYLGTNGTVYMTGSNALGTADDGQANTHTVAYTSPRQATTSGYEYESIMSIGMEGDPHSAVCAIRRNHNPGMVWCMGRNAMGQLGDGTCSNQGYWQVYGLPAGEAAKPVINEGAGYQMNSTMVITQSGKVYAAGDNTYGKLGTTHPLQSCNSQPRQVLLPLAPGSSTERVKAVALSNVDEYTSYILGDDGRVYAAGRNHNGQLGNGTVSDTATATPQVVRIPRMGVSF